MTVLVNSMPTVAAQSVLTIVGGTGIIFHPACQAQHLLSLVMTRRLGQEATMGAAQTGADQAAAAQQTEVAPSTIGQICGEQPNPIRIHPCWVCGDDCVSGFPFPAAPFPEGRRITGVRPFKFGLHEVPPGSVEQAVVFREVTDEGCGIALLPVYQLEASELMRGNVRVDELPEVCTKSFHRIERLSPRQA